jgi:hypothetical protein
MVDAVPSSPKKYLSSFKSDTRAASKDIIQLNEDIVPIEEMTNLIFEDIGGQELLSISRHDLINGQGTAYNPISNISKITKQYNSKNIISVHDSSDSIFNNFTIKLEDYLPKEYYSYTELGDIVYIDGSSVEIDPLTGDLVISISDIPDDEQVEVQILKSGTST